MSKPRLAYLLAPSHSGSTLLALLLGSHPDLCTVGELNLSAVDDPERYLCSCGERLRVCAFWQRVTEGMRERGVPFDVMRSGTDFRKVPSPFVARLMRPLHRGPMLEAVRDTALALSPTWRAHYPAIQQRNSALVASLLAQTGAKAIVDSSKIGIRLKFLLRNPDLDVRVIRVVRDGRAVALTYMDPARYADARDPKLRGGGTGGDRERERLPMKAAAHEWRRSHEEADAIVDSLPADRWMQVQYESVCSATDRTLGSIFDFLGVESSASRANFRRAGQHVVGNGMRLDTTTEIALDDRWTSVLTAEDRQMFESVAGPLNRRFGYAA